MIHCPRQAFEQTVSDRGYDLDDCLPCVVKVIEAPSGPVYAIDETHPSYPRWKTERPVSGVGGHLKAILGSIGIHATPNCTCNKKAAYLDRMGPDWTERNLDLVVGWLQEEARKRRLPFFKTAGRLLVRRAIMLARRR